LTETLISPKTLKVAVIGCGIGIEHLECYDELKPLVEITAICDLVEARAQKQADRFGVKTIYTDYKDVLADPNVDAVSICVPNDLHAQLSVGALKAGKHVLCEKPMTDTLAHAQEIVAAANLSPKKFMMAMNNRFSGETQLLKAMIDEGRLGEIYFAKTGWTRRNGIPGLGGWFTTKERSGGGPLLDIGVHALDRTVYLMGNPAPVSASGCTYAKFGPRGKGGSSYGAKPDPNMPIAFDVEDLAAGFVKFDNGATLFLEASWASYTERDNFYTSVLGTEGGADIPDFGKLKVYTDMGGSPVDITPHVPNISGRQGEINHFVSCIAEDKEPISTAQQGLHMLQILDALYQSAQTGREVVIVR